jgi:ribonuclease HI
MKDNLTAEERAQLMKQYRESKVPAAAKNGTTSTEAEKRKKILEEYRKQKGLPSVSDASPSAPKSLATQPGPATQELPATDEPVKPLVSQPPVIKPYDPSNFNIAEPVDPVIQKFKELPEKDQQFMAKLKVREVLDDKNFYNIKWDSPEGVAAREEISGNIDNIDQEIIQAKKDADAKEKLAFSNIENIFDSDEQKKVSEKYKLDYQSSVDHLQELRAQKKKLENDIKSPKDLLSMMKEVTNEAGGREKTSVVDASKKYNEKNIAEILSYVAPVDRKMIVAAEKLKANQDAVKQLTDKWSTSNAKQKQFIQKRKGDYKLKESLLKADIKQLERERQETINTNITHYQKKLQQAYADNNQHDIEYYNKEINSNRAFLKSIYDDKGQSIVERQSTASTDYIKANAAEFLKFRNLIPENVTPEEATAIYFAAVSKRHAKLKEETWEPSTVVGALAQDILSGVYMRDKQTQKVEDAKTIRLLAPIVYANRMSEDFGKDKQRSTADGWWSRAFGNMGRASEVAVKLAVEMNMPAQGDQLMTQSAAAQHLENVVSESGLQLGDASKITDIRSEVPLWSAEQVGQMVGPNIGLIPAFATGAVAEKFFLNTIKGIGIANKSKILTKIGASADILENIGKTGKLSNEFGQEVRQIGIFQKVASNTKAGKILDKARVGVIKGTAKATRAGMTYQWAGLTHPGNAQVRSEGDFLSGALGEPGRFLGEKLFGVFGKASIPIVKQIVELLKQGIGESLEEFFQTTYQTFRDSKDYNDFTRQYAQQFGHWGEALNFFASTMLMGMAMGEGTQLGRETAQHALDSYRKLDEVDKKTADEFVNRFQALSWISNKVENIQKTSQMSTEELQKFAFQAQRQKKFFEGNKDVTPEMREALAIETKTYDAELKKRGKETIYYSKRKRLLAAKEETDLKFKPLIAEAEKNLEDAKQLGIQDDIDQAQVKLDALNNVYKDRRTQAIDFGIRQVRKIGRLSLRGRKEAKVKEAEAVKVQQEKIDQLETPKSLVKKEQKNVKGRELLDTKEQLDELETKIGNFQDAINEGNKQQLLPEIEKLRTEQKSLQEKADKLQEEHSVLHEEYKSLRIKDTDESGTPYKKILNKFKGKVIYATPGSGKTFFKKQLEGSNQPVVDTDELLLKGMQASPMVQELAKFLKKDITMETMGDLSYAMHTHGSENNVEIKKIYTQLEKRTHELAAKGYTVLTGSAKLQEKANIVLSKNHIAAIEKDINSVDRPNKKEIPYEKKNVVKLLKDIQDRIKLHPEQEVIQLGENQYVGDVISEAGKPVAQTQAKPEAKLEEAPAHKIVSPAPFVKEQVSESQKEIDAIDWVNSLSSDQQHNIDFTQDSRYLLVRKLAEENKLDEQVVGETVYGNQIRYKYKETLETQKKETKPVINPIQSLQSEISLENQKKTEHEKFVAELEKKKIASKAAFDQALRSSRGEINDIFHAALTGGKILFHLSEVIYSELVFHGTKLYYNRDAIISKIRQNLEGKVKDIDSCIQRTIEMVDHRYMEHIAGMLVNNLVRYNESHKTTPRTLYEELSDLKDYTQEYIGSMDEATQKEILKMVNKHQSAIMSMARIRFEVEKQKNNLERATRERLGETGAQKTEAERKQYRKFFKSIKSSRNFEQVERHLLELSQDAAMETSTFNEKNWIRHIESMIKKVGNINDLENYDEMKLDLYTKILDEMGFGQFISLHNFYKDLHLIQAQAILFNKSNTINKFEITNINQEDRIRQLENEIIHNLKTFTYNGTENNAWKALSEYITDMKKRLNNTNDENEWAEILERLTSIPKSEWRKFFKDPRTSYTYVSGLQPYPGIIKGLMSTAFNSIEDVSNFFNNPGGKDKSGKPKDSNTQQHINISTGNGKIAMNYSGVDGKRKTSFEQSSDLIRSIMNVLKPNTFLDKNPVVQFYRKYSKQMELVKFIGMANRLNDQKTDVGYLIENDMNVMALIQFAMKSKAEEMGDEETYLHPLGQFGDKDQVYLVRVPYHKNGKAVYNKLVADNPDIAQWLAGEDEVKRAFKIYLETLKSSFDYIGNVGELIANNKINEDEVKNFIYNYMINKVYSDQIVFGDPRSYLGKKDKMFDLTDLVKRAGSSNSPGYTLNTTIRYGVGWRKRIVQTIQKVIQPKVNNPKDFVNHSGGAGGGDETWDIIGSDEFGQKTHRHYREPGQTTVDSNELRKRGTKAIAASDSDYKEGIIKATAAAQAMGRRISQQYGYYQYRNWLQVKYADSIYAVSTILEKGQKDKKGYIAQTKQVEGGTGYAVQMAIAEGKPVFVFDQVKNKWFTWNGNDFVETETPTLTKNYAGIGSRTIHENGRQAIRDVYNKTFPKTQVQPQQRKQLGTKEKPLEVFVDGSDIKGTGAVGFGVNLSYDNKEHSISGAYDNADLSKLEKDLGVKIEGGVSNGLMELFGSLVAIRNTPKGEHIKIHQDMEGVQMWILSTMLKRLNGLQGSSESSYKKWFGSLTAEQQKAKVAEVMTYVELDADLLDKQKFGTEAISKGFNAKENYIEAAANKIADQIMERKGEVSYKWVKGHSGLAGNEKVDAIAKDRNTYNSYKKLFESQQPATTTTETSKEIYPKLGNKTVSGNVKLSTNPIQSAKDNGGIAAYRQQALPDNHWGNPWGTAETQKFILLKTPDIKTAVDNFIDWLTTDKFKDVDSVRRQNLINELKSGNLKGKPVWYYKELGEPSHATALDYLINKYDWNKQTQPTQEPTQQPAAQTEETPGIPKYTIDTELKNKDGSKKLASSSAKTGEIKINPVQTVDEFFDYFEGRESGPTSIQKQKILDELSNYDYDLEDIKKLLTSVELINAFLAFHEQSHLDNKDADTYWKNDPSPGVHDYLTQDKINIEVRATLDALKEMEKISGEEKTDTFTHVVLNTAEIPGRPGLSDQFDGFQFMSREWTDRAAISMGYLYSNLITDKNPSGVEKMLSSIKALFSSKTDGHRGLTKSNVVCIEELAKLYPDSKYSQINDYMKEHNIDTLSFESSTKKTEGEDLLTNAVSIVGDKFVVDKSVKPTIINRPIENLFVQQDLRHNVSPHPESQPTQTQANALPLQHSNVVQKLWNEVQKKFLADQVDEWTKATDEEKRAMLIEIVDEETMYDLAMHLEDGGSLNDIRYRDSIRGIIAKELKKGALTRKINRVVLQELPGADLGLLEYRRSKNADGTDGEIMLYAEVDCNIEGIRYESNGFETKQDALKEIRSKPNRYSDMFVIGDDGYFTSNISHLEVVKKGDKWYIPGSIVSYSRVPADDLHSHTVARARKRITNGNFIITDRQSQITAGSDFDGDKRYVESAFKYKDDVDKKQKIDMRPESSRSNSNRAMYLFAKDYQNPDNYERIVRPIDLKRYDSTVERLRERLKGKGLVRGSSKGGKINDPVAMTDTRNQNNVGRRVISIVSKLSTAFEYGKAAGFFLNMEDANKRSIAIHIPKMSTRDKTEHYSSLHTGSTKLTGFVEDRFGIIKNNIGIFQNLALDNGKDPKIEVMGFNETTANMVSFALMMNRNLDKAESAEDQEQMVIEYIDNLAAVFNSPLYQEFINYTRKNKQVSEDTFVDQSINRQLHDWAIKNQDILPGGITTTKFGDQYSNDVTNLTNWLYGANELNSIGDLIDASRDNTGDISEYLNDSKTVNKVLKNGLKYINTESIIKGGKINPLFEMGVEAMRASKKILFNDDVILRGSGGNLFYGILDNLFGTKTDREEFYSNDTLKSIIRSINEALFLDAVGTRKSLKSLGEHLKAALQGIGSKNNAFVEMLDFTEWNNIQLSKKYRKSQLSKEEKITITEAFNNLPENMNIYKNELTGEYTSLYEENGKPNKLVAICDVKQDLVTYMVAMKGISTSTWNGNYIPYVSNDFFTKIARLIEDKKQRWIDGKIEQEDVNNIENIITNKFASKAKDIAKGVFAREDSGKLIKDSGLQKLDIGFIRTIMKQYIKYIRKYIAANPTLDFLSHAQQIFGIIKASSETTSREAYFFGRIVSDYSQRITEGYTKDFATYCDERIASEDWESPHINYMKPSDAAAEMLASGDVKLQEFVREHLMQAYPGVQVFTSREAFRDFIKRQYAWEGDFDMDSIGMAFKDAVFIDPDKATQSTFYHEFAHLYWDALPSNHPVKKRLLKRFGNDMERVIIAIGQAGTTLAEEKMTSDKYFGLPAMLKDFWRAVKEVLGMQTDIELAKSFAAKIWDNRQKFGIKDFDSDYVRNMIPDNAQSGFNEKKKIFLSKGNEMMSSASRLIQKIQQNVFNPTITAVNKVKGEDNLRESIGDPRYTPEEFKNRVGEIVSEWEMTATDGSAVHQTIEFIGNQQQFPQELADRFEPGVLDQFRDDMIQWEKKHKPAGAVSKSEVQVPNEDNMVGGIIDRVWDNNGSITIIDFKTSKKSKYDPATGELSDDYIENIESAAVKPQFRKKWGENAVTGKPEEKLVQLSKRFIHALQLNIYASLMEKVKDATGARANNTVGSNNMMIVPILYEYAANGKISKITIERNIPFTRTTGWIKYVDKVFEYNKALHAETIRLNTTLPPLSNMFCDEAMDEQYEAELDLMTALGIEFDEQGNIPGKTNARGLTEVTRTEVFSIMQFGGRMMKDFLLSKGITDEVLEHMPLRNRLYYLWNKANYKGKQTNLQSEDIAKIKELPYGDEETGNVETHNYETENPSVQGNAAMISKFLNDRDKLVDIYEEIEKHSVKGHKASHDILQKIMDMDVNSLEYFEKKLRGMDKWLVNDLYNTITAVLAAETIAKSVREENGVAFTGFKSATVLLHQLMTGKLTFSNITKGQGWGWNFTNDRFLTSQHRLLQYLVSEIRQRSSEVQYDHVETDEMVKLLKKCDETILFDYKPGQPGRKYFRNPYKYSLDENSNEYKFLDWYYQKHIQQNRKTRYEMTENNQTKEELMFKVPTEYISRREALMHKNLYGFWFNRLFRPEAFDDTPIQITNQVTGKVETTTFSQYKDGFVIGTDSIKECNQVKKAAREIFEKQVKDKTIEKAPEVVLSGMSTRKLKWESTKRRNIVASYLNTLSRKHHLETMYPIMKYVESKYVSAINTYNWIQSFGGKQIFGKPVTQYGYSWTYGRMENVIKALMKMAAMTSLAINPMAAVINFTIGQLSDLVHLGAYDFIVGWSRMSTAMFRKGKSWNQTAKILEELGIVDVTNEHSYDKASSGIWNWIWNKFPFILTEVVENLNQGVVIASQLGWKYDAFDKDGKLKEANDYVKNNTDVQDMIVYAFDKGLIDNKRLRNAEKGVYEDLIINIGGKNSINKSVIEDIRPELLLEIEDAYAKGRINDAKGKALAAKVMTDGSNQNWVPGKYKKRAGHFKGWAIVTDQEISIIENTNRNIHGDYGVKNSSPISYTPLGQAAMQFRRWIPAMIMAHYAKGSVDKNGIEQRGIFVTFWQTAHAMIYGATNFSDIAVAKAVRRENKGKVLTKADMSFLKDKKKKQMMKVRVENYEKMTLHEKMVSFDRLIARIDKDPVTAVNIYKHLSNTDKKNLSKLAYEMVILLGMIAAKTLEPDDKDKTGVWDILKWVAYQRTFGDILYVVDPRNFQKLLESPLAIIRTIRNIGMLITTSAAYVGLYATSKEYREYRDYPTKARLAKWKENIFASIAVYKTTGHSDYKEWETGQPKLIGYLLKLMPFGSGYSQVLNVIEKSNPLPKAKKKRKSASTMKSYEFVPAGKTMSGFKKPKKKRNSEL